MTDTDIAIAKAAREWSRARKAFLSLPPNDPRAREALTDLANAEAVLQQAVDAH